MVRPDVEATDGHLDKQRWKRAQELYHAARELRISDRSRFLEFHCGEDARTRALVERLLKSTEESRFLADGFEEDEERE